MEQNKKWVEQEFFLKKKENQERNANFNSNGTGTDKNQ